MKKERTPEQKARNKALRALRISERRQIVYKYLLDHPCVDCGEADPVVLDFDHVRGVKSSNIGNMIHRNGVEAILKEMKKCEVRCACCHRRVTAIEHNWWIVHQTGA
jgi:L-lysine 2,3-aminomutase|tara:strand:- start:2069 stop:2389 length:321 start_codon:yes stop_codon:yes gene_type:complete